MPGGAIELVRRLEALRDRGEAWRLLARDYPRIGPPLEPELLVEEDFCRIPEECTPFSAGRPPGLLGSEALRFTLRQWGVGFQDALRWGLGWSARGRYAWRVIIPVVMGSQPVSFQARAFRLGAGPKYLNARHGSLGDPRAECGRSAAACLFNRDAVEAGRDVVVVEGAGDVMALARDGVTAVGLLGQSMTPQKLALIVSARPRRAIVALDAGDAEQRRAAEHAADLESWGVPSVLGEWVGGKDAGAGAALKVDGGRRGLLSRVSGMLSSGRASCGE